MKYQWTDEMAGVSEFGGEYEKTCREMVITGLEWLDRNAGPTAEFTGSKNIIVQIDESAEEINTLRDHMATSISDDPSASMLHLCVKHALYAHELGWETYVKRMENSV